jgi:hypothetical protein
MTTFIQAGFIILTIVMLVLILSELKKGIAKTSLGEARRKSIFNKVLYAIIGWMSLISALSLTGFLNNFSTFPPRIIIVLIVPLIVMITVTFSSATREILAHIPAKNIVRLQVFRVFVEILLWMLVVQNLLPVQMSFEGRNFDVISGLTAPFAAYFLVNNRAALIAWNFLTLALLINILGIAILSMPTPFRVFMNEPSNTIVTTFPYVWLPGLLVPMAYGLSFLSLRQISVTRTINASI